MSSEFPVQKSVVDQQPTGYRALMLTLPPFQEMYEAFLQRDSSYEGVFVAAVKTTSIFCRPTCSAKKPRIENVEFFPGAQEALLAGYRPCKRCQPLRQTHEHPQWIQPLFHMLERNPTKRYADADLRTRAIDPVRTRRYFKKHYGVTFQTYQRTKRISASVADLKKGSSVTAVSSKNGFCSESGFREAFAKLFDVPPSYSKDVRCLYAQRLNTPLGPMFAAANDEGICLLNFMDSDVLQSQVAHIKKKHSSAILPGEHAHLRTLEQELDDYFAGSLRQFTVPFVFTGSPFQCAVWKELQTVAYGRTVSYADIAKGIGKPGAQRAVGKANGDNPLMIVVPCHRVVRSDGSLSGYSGGLRRKQWLLEHERKH